MTHTIRPALLQKTLQVGDNVYDVERWDARQQENFANALAISAAYMEESRFVGTYCGDGAVGAQIHVENGKAIVGDVTVISHSDNPKYDYDEVSARINEALNSL